MAEPKSIVEVLEDMAGTALGAVVGYHIGQRYTKKDPYVMSMAGGAIGALVSDTAKKLIAEGVKQLHPSQAQKELESMFESARQSDKNFKNLIESIKNQQ
jgi:hypothetical protein